MRRSLVLTLAITILSVGGRAYADPVAAGDIIKLQLTNTDGSTINRFSNGGPFRFDIAGGNTYDFLTYCLEMNEYFTPGENLLVGKVSEYAMAGGVDSNPDPGDRISGTTAYVYTQFRDGVAAYSNGALLQEVIWALEEERTTGVSAAALNLIATAHGEMASIGWALDFLGDVRVANLYRGTNYQTFAQDMLVRTSVPEPATGLLFGVGALIAARET